MVRTGSLGCTGAAGGASSSDMPFLKALIPFATSPIMSEILPRPKSRTTIRPTTIQCQILAPPMAILLRLHGATDRFQRAANLRIGRGENKDILWINLEPQILADSGLHGIVNAGLKRPVDPWNVDL